MATGGLFPAIMSFAQNTGLDLTTSSNFTPTVQMLIAAGVQALFIVAFCRIALLYYNLPDVVEETPKSKTKTESQAADVDTKPKQELLSPLLDDDSEATRQALSTTSDDSVGAVAGEATGEGEKEDGRDEASEVPGKGEPCRCRCADSFSYVPYTTIFVLYLCTYALPSLAPYMITNYDAATSKSIYTIMNLGSVRVYVRLGPYLDC